MKIKVGDIVLAVDHAVPALMAKPMLSDYSLWFLRQARKLREEKNLFQGARSALIIRNGFEDPPGSGVWKPLPKNQAQVSEQIELMMNDEVDIPLETRPLEGFLRALNVGGQPGVVEPGVLDLIMFLLTEDEPKVPEPARPIAPENIEQP